MLINVLGSGAAEGIPAIFCECRLCTEAREKKIYHTRSQVLIDGELLIDFPPDTYYRALCTGTDLSKIKNILITHSHSDHCFVGELQTQRMQTPIHVHANQTVCSLLIDGQRDKSNLIVHLRRSFETFAAGDFTVTALPATHMANEECLIWLIEKNGKTILYATDTEYLRDEVLYKLSEQCIRLDALIVDGTYGIFDMRGCGHMCFNDNAKLRGQLIQCGIADKNTRFFITHIFHGAAPDMSSLDNAVPDGYELLRDGHVFEI